SPDVRGRELPLPGEERAHPIEEGVDLRAPVAAREDAPGAEALAARPIETASHFAEQLTDLGPPCVVAELLHALTALALVEDLLPALLRGVGEARRVAVALEFEGASTDLTRGDRPRDTPLAVVGLSRPIEEGVDLTGLVAELTAPREREGALILRHGL